ncbi:siderophore-interacting protein [Leucobacter sp. CSA1]|uniref:Siderophore-interacting protein n=1 Tax=Leucobacter chromiisoli TaxID=2796471 RepID=A0A934Q3L9_9MICO|nr:siderophore-interacting protein [Leucobacter chromiisoli]MBK0417764.1 siderophore-interacting protein [Leucobacter chromiisoli]
MAHRDFVTHPLVLRRLEVIRVRDVTPRMRRVTLGGPQLFAFERDGLSLGPFHAPGFDDHVKAIFAAPDELERALPVQLAEGIEWRDAPARISRDYTPRRVDLAAGEVDLDFVLHGDGPASNWAREARPGDDLWIVGPKSSIVLPDRPDWVALIGDETALPAIGRFLDERPLDAPARIVVTISDPTSRQELSTRPDDTVEWVVAAPTDRAALERAVRAALPEAGEGFVWASGESRTLLPLRRYLGRERRIPKNRMCVTGYWHADDELAPAHPEVPSPVAWLTVRAAVGGGVLDELADRPGALARELAERCGIAAAALAAMLPVLVHHGMVSVAEEGGALALGPAGEALLASDHGREEFDGHDGDIAHALAALPEALAAGGTAWERAHGETFADRLRSDAALFEEQCEEAAMLRFFALALFRDSIWEGVRRALLLGPGAAEIADLAREAGLAAELAVGGDGVQAGVLAGLTEHASSDDGADVDVVVLALALKHRTDAEARDLLASLRARAGGLVVVDPARPDSLDPHAHEAHALALAVNGAGMRSSEALAALGRESGWRLERSVPLGWGVEATVFEPIHPANR